MDKITRFQITDLCDHQRQQCVGSDVKRHTKQDIGAALIQLARQLAIRDIKLKQVVTGRQSQIIDFCRVPCTDNQTA